MEVEQNTLSLPEKNVLESQTQSRTKENDAGVWYLSLTALCPMCTGKLVEYDLLKASEEKAHSYLT